MNFHFLPLGLLLDFPEEPVLLDMQLESDFINIGLVYFIQLVEHDLHIRHSLHDISSQQLLQDNRHTLIIRLHLLES